MDINKIIIAPDSFKGTMSSIEVCDIVERAIRQSFPDADIVKVPMADGGEGTVDAFLSAAGGENIHAIVKDPFFNDINASYGVLQDGRTAIIEMAAASGLILAGDSKNPWKTSTYGTGQMIRHAIDAGCSRLIIGLGGSATNDGGAGMAAALGMKLLDIRGNSIDLNGGGLAALCRIEPQGFIEKLASTEVILASDVDNPLCGPDGASYVFGPQKGADPEMIIKLDANLLQYAEIIKAKCGKNIGVIPGSGAAGGFAVPFLAFTDAVLKSGIDIMLDLTGFDSIIDNADFIITGEGKLDGQSLRGKVPVGVARRASKKGIPVIAVVGGVEGDPSTVYQEGISAIFTTLRRVAAFEEIKRTCRADLHDAILDILRLLKQVDT